MKRLNALLLISFALFFVATSCSDKNKLPTPSKPGDKNIPLVSQFVYDGLSSYYLWSSEMLDKKPTESNTDPEKYFKSVLNKTDTDNGWSWITDDVEGLLADFAGEPKSFGYSIGGFYKIENKIYALLRYVYTNTPASQAGMERLDLIGEIDGKPITANSEGYISDRDINILYGENKATFTTYKFIDDGVTLKKEVQVTPRTTKNDPILFDKVYTIGNKKIGYLFYTNFTGNYNHRLFEVFSHFKNEKVTDLVLDLRYNPGGVITAASYLVSLFAPVATVKDKITLTTLSYNKYLNDYFGSRRDTKLGTYTDKDGKLLHEGALNPLDANLNLNKVYIIATERSASASELTTFCSRAIMGDANVVHIGGKTSGKYTASWTIHPYDDNLGQPVYVEEKLSAKQKETFKNWAMQPIVAIYKDKNGKDFVNPGYLEPDFALEEGFGKIYNWKPLGDTKDVLLGQALYIITGDATYKPIEPTATRSIQKQIRVIESGRDDAKPLVLDNIELNEEDFMKIRKMMTLED